MIGPILRFGDLVFNCYFCPHHHGNSVPHVAYLKNNEENDGANIRIEWW